jgi:RNA polymerase sigma-70 factor, ECF subfamily
MTQADLTELLRSAEAGDATALDLALPLIYEELRDLARRHLRRESDGHTLTPTALVHEAYLKLVDQTRVAWQGRAQFLGVASLAMRRILVNHARDRKRLKRGGSAQRLSLTAGLDIATPEVEQDSGFVIRLDELLDRLAAFDPRAAKVVECRYFAGLAVGETAAVLGVGTATIKRDWALARAWLRRELTEG